LELRVSDVFSPEAIHQEQAVPHIYPNLKRRTGACKAVELALQNQHSRQRMSFLSIGVHTKDINIKLLHDPQYNAQAFHEAIDSNT
jgi:hypothetical protein